MFCVLPKPNPLNILPFQTPKTKCGIVLINVSPIIKSIIEKFINIIFYRTNVRYYFNCTSVRMHYLCEVDTKKKILNTARILYNKRGLNNVTTRMICENLKISLGSYSYHYPDKKVIIKSLYLELQKELQSMYSVVKNEEPSIITYLDTHKELFKIQSKYKFFYLNLFEILSNYETIRIDFIQNTSNERILAEQILKYYIKQGILCNDLNKKNIERIINVGQILNNFWAIDAEISSNKNIELSYYMEICCGLLEPYLEPESLEKYHEYFSRIEKTVPNKGNH